MIMVNNFFLSAMNALAAFPPERAVFLMEQRTGAYNPFMYFLAKTVAELPFQVFFPMIFGCIIYFMIGFVRTAAQFFIQLFFLVLIANCGGSYGAFVAAFFPNAESAFAILPITFLPLTLVAGLFANTARLDPYWVWLNYVSFPRYAYIGLYLNEMQNLGDLCTPGTCQYSNGNDAVTWWMCAIALAIMTLGFRVLAACALAFQGYRQQGKIDFTDYLTRRAAASNKQPGANEIPLTTVQPFAQ